MNRRLSIVVVAALVAAAALGQSALANTITPTYSGAWGQNQEVPFRWKEDGVPPEWMRTAVVNAAGDSTRSRRAKAAVIVQRSGGDSWVSYTADLPSSTALAFAARNAPERFRVWMRVQGYRFDWGVLRWCQFYDDPPNGCFDARTVALHEFGHVQALQHSSVQPPHTVMQPISLAKPKDHYNARDFGPCDVAGLQIRYEPLSPSTPISTCLSLASDLTLATSGTAVSSGEYVTLTATLLIDPTVSFAKLAGDPLSGRSVILQRRSPGTSSWTNVSAMSAGSAEGRYRLTVKPAATYEWRAVFSEPADEGLHGSTSGLIKVTVAYECTSDPCPV